MKRTFNFAKGKEFEVKGIIEKAEIPFTWEWEVCICPHCQKKITQERAYTLDRIEILESSDQTIYLGFTKEKVGDRAFTFRLPDKDFHSNKDMTDLITSKRNKPKE